MVRTAAVEVKNFSRIRGTAAESSNGADDAAVQRFLRPPPLRFRPPFLRGTFAPARRASLRPIAIPCLRLVTFVPERPDLSVPCFRSCIARSTSLCAFFPYFAMQIPPVNGCKADAPVFGGWGLVTRDVGRGN